LNTVFATEFLNTVFDEIVATQRFESLA